MIQFCGAVMHKQQHGMILAHSMLTSAGRGGEVMSNRMEEPIS